MTTKRQLLFAYNVMAGSSLEQCEVKERIEVVKILRKMRSEAESFQGFIDDLREKNMDIIGSNDPTIASRVGEINAAIEAEGNKEVEMQDLKVLSRATYEKILMSNPKWSGEAMLTVEDVLVSV